MYFLPDFGSAPILMAEFASFLAEKGHDVEVITTFPREKKEKKYKYKLYLKEKKENFIVKRFWTNSSQTPIGRFIAWSIYTFWTICHVLFRVKKEDKLFLRLPPLQLGLTGILAQKLKRAKFILNVQDIYPDLAIESGILKNRWVVKLAKNFEKWIYKHSDCIVVISEGFKENLKQKGVPDWKIKVIPNWADTNRVRPLSKNNRVSKRLALEKKFVIMYVGTITLSSFEALERFIEVANLLKEEKDIVFAIVGEGIKKESLIEKVQELGCSNVKFFPLSPQEDLPYILASSDLLIVPLDVGKSQLSVPSKLYIFMAAGRPILGLAPEDSEITRIINQAKCGFSLKPENINEIVKAIKDLKSSKILRENFGKNARKYVEKNLAKEKILNIYESLLSSL
jgi:colanic acid biosynthesis glycosyl transferase WcaI